MSTEIFDKTGRTTLKRHPERGKFDRAEVYPILDEALICHVGFNIEGQPYVIPTSFARIDDTVMIHGSAASRMLRAVQGGIPVCVTVTILDGLVLARSVYNSSMNYRSVVMLGEARLVTDPKEKWDALLAFSEHMLKGRWDEAREPSALELKATSVLSLPLEEVSAKVRKGDPIDDKEDHALPVWAGVVPITLTMSAPISDPQLAAGTAVSSSVKARLKDVS
jgi:nitroimidazol reductase NimA-like FMN-containing flavoprotein (pyridoxamine 5'-phosphate oxidase superfamily)